MRLTFYENGKILFGGNEIAVETAYPFDGKIKIRLTRCDAPIKLACRIPSWYKGYSHNVVGSLEKGYFITGIPLSSGDELTLQFDMPFVIRNSADFDPEVKDLFCVSRGPVVFATEDYADRIFCENSICDYRFEGITSSATLKSKDGAESTLRNYSSVGVDWSLDMTVWLKKQ